jgi:hypothetical protein
MSDDWVDYRIEKLSRAIAEAPDPHTRADMQEVLRVLSRQPCPTCGWVGRIHGGPCWQTIHAYRLFP